AVRRPLAPDGTASAERRTRERRLRAERAGAGALAEKTLSPQTVKNIVQTLRKMLASAKRWDEIDTLPEIDTVKVDRPKIDFFDFEEADRLLTTIERAPDLGHGDDLDLIMTGMRLGLRAGELLGLQWQHLDFVKGEARIETQLA